MAAWRGKRENQSIEKRKNKLSIRIMALSMAAAAQR